MLRTGFQSLVCPGLLLLIASRCLLAADLSAVDFGRDIRPILSNHCFQCHGSDAATREADLRLDLRDAAVEMGAINLKSPLKSELLARIQTHDLDEKMPPAEANKSLSATQVQLIENWLKQGADYGAHWAFERVHSPSIPVVEDLDWCRNEIDHFIFNRLKQAGLPPSAEADRVILIRRLYQDLLGLLPTPREVDEFVADASPEAYEQLVERLLASPHYGERWGRHWLDQARYADSNGYTIDGPRVMWPYRDWVISSLNNDLPFDQFTIEQLAGDLLSKPTKGQLVATAFHRNTMINQEGGVKADQFRNEALIDRTNTTGAVWLGLTVGCAQCHSHKFDPITHNEYYGLYAFFNDAVDANNVGPTVDVYEAEIFGWTPEQTAGLKELTQLRKEIAALDQQTQDETGLTNIDWNWNTPRLLSHQTESGAQFTLQESGELLASKQFAAHERYSIDLQLPVDEAGKPYRLTAIRLRVLPDPTLPMQGPGTAGNGNFVLTELGLKSGEETQPFSRAWADHSQPDFSIAGVIDNNPKTGWAINVDATQAKAGHKMNAPHEAILALSQPLEVNEEQIISIEMKHELNANYLVGHFAIEVSSTEIPVAEDQAELKSQLSAAKDRERQLIAILPGKGTPAKQMIIQPQSQPPETYRLIRGDFLDPDKESGPLHVTVPAALVTTGHPPQLENRLDLAHWIVSRENPLTARVTVNRIWAKYFGRGLVATENDFGYQGTAPTHPELLDWLAAQFMENGWSLKGLHRLIVNSATYRQVSDFTPELMAREPNNNLLGRQSRFRVEAEIVRDQALAASGLLTSTLGGPSVHPPQQEGIYNFTQNKKSWPTETGPNRYRRTMYTMFYRSAPYPLLSTFDAPDFSTTCTQRVRSNTPLQSLTIANDLVFKELAEGLANRVLHAENIGTESLRIELMFRYALTRNPAVEELEILTAYFERELERFQSSPMAASEFVETDLQGSDLQQLAAYTSLARVLLNTDEFMTRN